MKKVDSTSSPRRSNTNSGFTLIELFIVITVIILLGTSTSVFFSRFLLQSNADQVANNLAEELHKAQTYSMMNRFNSSWGVKFAAGNITLFATASAAFNEDNAVNPNVTISGFNQVIFTKGTGTPDATFSATIHADAVNRNVSINSQGGISR